MAKKIEEEYKKLSQNDHVLQRPGMYLGSIESITKSMYVSDIDLNIEKREVTYVPAFMKLFDEILTNASDHAIRCGNKVKNIKIYLKSDLSEISIYNDGPGIPIEMHKEEKMYVPELIFGHLLSGSNFDDKEERFVGGMNGMGSVLVNLFSNKFIVETADKKKLYYQEYNNNLNIVNKPIITDSKESYTKITYFPDFKRLPLPYENGTNGQITNIKDTYDLIIKRCIDIAAYNLGVNVFVNDKKINIKTLTDYIKLHTVNENVFIETINDNYTIAVTESITDNFENISIVNGITTYIGGTHVNIITDQLIEEIKNKLIKGNKNIKIRNNDIKNKLMVFIICKLPNPVFDTQSKENLISKIINKPVISEKFIKQICNSAIIENIREWVSLKEQAELAKINKGKATNVRIAKLQDAHKAGTKEGKLCSLFLAEGLSARSSVISGISVLGNEYYGVFPLKGKPLNVRDKATSRITDNEEITNIIKAVGLVIGKKYTSVEELRYGCIIAATDADCLESNTLVKTDNGIKSIKDIDIINDKVLTHTNEYKKIINKKEIITDKKCTIVVNGLTVVCSQDHIWPIYRNNEIQLIKAKDIKYDDFILIKK